MCRQYCFKVSDLRGLQVHHERRAPGDWRIDSGGLFGGAQQLRFHAGRRYAEGELVTVDFGPEKLDSQLLLDYGVLDTARPQVLLMQLAVIPNYRLSRHPHHCAVHPRSAAVPLLIR